MIMGMKGDDLFVGDSMVTGDGPRPAAAATTSGLLRQGLRGRRQLLALRAAIGGGDDEINAGPANDLIIGDSYTKTGFASGAGTDQLHSLQGNDTAYGDDHAATPRARISGGAHDFIGGSSGDDHLFGGPEPRHLQRRAELRTRRASASTCSRSRRTTPERASERERFSHRARFPLLGSDGRA